MIVLPDTDPRGHVFLGFIEVLRLLRLLRLARWVQVSASEPAEHKLQHLSRQVCTQAALLMSMGGQLGKRLLGVLPVTVVYLTNIL